ncbi:glycosyltransferase family 4 protein [Roseospira navarrensis]|uniref:Glycosyltransferase n=1 Tax=Roseospira navarrensis TaxID=140058 RepID=A0A7X2D2K1_9PROT|nr:glycosyltransferase family 4 protein [Roseospira navarrensis]MQX36369.1 glycosyltransferase [Roseospira navarrensis]
MPDPLRLLLWHWGRRGGGPRYTHELARVLAARDDVEVHLSLSRQSEYFDVTDSLGLPAHHIDTYANLPQFALRSMSLPLIRRELGRYIARHRIEVVFCTMDHLWDAFVAPEIGRRGALYLLAVHDANRHPGEDQGFRQWLLRRDVACADGAVTLTRSVGEGLVTSHAFPPDRVWKSTLGSFAYTGRTTPRTLPKDRPPRLLFFGRILPYKGLDLMLEALPALQKRFPGLTLEVWGSGDLAPHRRRLDGLSGVRLENRWIGEDEIPHIFADTDLAVLPYREASQSAVVATAFSDAMPCVATPLPGLREQVTDGRDGIVASAAGAEAFAAAVTRALEDDTRYAALSAGALETAATQLDWRPIGDTIADAAFALRRIGPRRKGVDH